MVNFLSHVFEIWSDLFFALNALKILRKEEEEEMLFLVHCFQLNILYKSFNDYLTANYRLTQISTVFRSLEPHKELVIF